MSEELIDIVNEKDEIVGKTTKKEAHTKGLFHRTTAILILNNEGQIALQKRAKNYDGGGLLDHSAAGHLLSGEHYKSAALRELNEELGIYAELIKIRNKLVELHDSIDSKKIRHIYRLFIGRHNGPFEFQESEVESVNFYDGDAIKEMIKNNPEKFTEGLKISLKVYSNYI